LGETYERSTLRSEAIRAVLMTAPCLAATTAYVSTVSGGSQPSNGQLQGTVV